MTEIVWYTFPKDKLPDALLSSSPPIELGGKLVSNPAYNTLEITIGYFDCEMQLDCALPGVIVLPANASAELLSWLKTYAPDTSPLSQFSRVLSNKEFKLYKISTVTRQSRIDFLQRWPSLILGEIFAQGEVDTTIDSLPLSRCLASYSNTIAKATITHNDKTLYDLCVERLEAAEMDRRFVSRTLKLRDLKPVWSKIDAHWDSGNVITKIVDIFAHSEGSVSDLFDTGSKITQLVDYPELLSDSIEARVISFRKLIRDLLERLDSPSNKDGMAAMFATAAFLVGRSTSHIFLLKGVDKLLPSVYAWFGLIAGIVGPRYWEVEWTRAAKGIEKNLRTKLDWSEPNQSDLSWTEYEWLTETYRNASPFVELPKQLPKVLSIEILPGAGCQFRLALDNSNSNRNLQAEVDLREANILKNLLLELSSLTERTKFQLTENERSKHYVEGDDNSRVKRGRGRTGSSGVPKK